MEEGNFAPMVGAVMNLIDQHGGVSGLLSQLKAGGLQDVVESWIGNSTNQSVDPEQLHRAIGSEAVDQAAQASGLSSNDFITQLAQNLPNFVDHVTPNQQLVEPTNNNWLGTAMQFFKK